MSGTGNVQAGPVRIGGAVSSGHSMRGVLALFAVFAMISAACSSGSSVSTETAGPASGAQADADAAASAATDNDNGSDNDNEAPVEAGTYGPGEPEPVRVNHMQVIGSHNSYHLIPRPEIFGALELLAKDLAESIEYSHRPLTEQLDQFGIRQFEIDVFADPEGGLFSSHAAHSLVGLDPPSGDPRLDEPGFKVLHTQDFDYATTCVSFVLCLSEIDAWSDANPNHLPITVMIEIKDQTIEEAAANSDVSLDFDVPWAIPVKTDADVLADLDAEIRSVFGADQMITPDDVRGTATTLESAVLETGWPLVSESRGKIIFTMVNGGEVRSIYTDGAPNLEGRPIFTDGVAGSPDAAFMRFDDPNDPGLAAASQAGYLIRTRTDSPTEDARTNDRTRLDAALASGAHFLSTDYYTPSIHFDSPYVAQLPGGAVARCNPISAPAGCSDDQFAE